MLKKILRYKSIFSLKQSLYAFSYLPKKIIHPSISYSTSFKFAEQKPTVETEIYSHKCNGCGVKLQTLDSLKEGYIEQGKLENIIKHNENVIKAKEMISNPMISLKAQSLLRDIKKKYKNSKHENVMLDLSDTDILEELDRENITNKGELREDLMKKKPKSLICARCHSLKYKNKFEKDISARVLKSDPEVILNKIFNQIRSNSTILNLIDLSDFSSTLSSKVIEYAKKKHCNVIIVANKFDSLPKFIKESRIKFWIRSRLNELGITISPENIHIVSSKSKHGIKDLAKYLKDQAEHLSKKDQNLYVIGCTNVGKSSFINAIIKDSNRYEKKRYHDPYEVKEEDQIRKLSDNISEVSEKKEIEARISDGNIELTASPYPGTTLELMKIEDLHLGWRIFDSPGIPNPSHITTAMENIDSLPTLLNQKEIKEKMLKLRNFSSLWIGGLARIDNKADFEVSCIVYASNLITLHKTQQIKANELYIKHYNTLLKPVYNEDITKVEFEKHRFTIEFDDRGLGRQELDIHGLGWIGFQVYSKNGDSTCEFDLYLPKKIGFTIRESLVNMRLDKLEPIERLHVNI